MTPPASDKPTDNAAALMGLLDKAYEAPDKPDNFNELMQAARALFFSSDQDEPLSLNLQGFDDQLLPHISRIQKLLDAAPAGPGAGDKSGYGHFTLTEGGGVLDGDRTAASFLGVTFPAMLGDFNLNAASKRKLREALSGDNAQTVLLLMTANEDKAAAALCRKSNDGASARMKVSLSHIDWDQDTVDFVGLAFELTQSETEVLAGHLRGFSQAEIAKERGRSLETIKAQAKSVLRKSGCAKMADTVRLGASIALFYKISQQTTTPPHDELCELPIAKTLPLKNGRILGYYEYGAPGGFPLLFFHGSLSGPFFTKGFVAGLTAMGVRLYAPSRPGFGQTTTAANYNQTTLDDAVALLESIGAQDVILVAHQGGVSHAFRCAARLGERARGMVMIGAGIPVTEKAHVRRMDHFTRIAAQAVRHAPALMEMITRIAMSTYKRRGYDQFFDDYFSGSAADLAAMRNPEIYRLMEQGLLHVIMQGPKTFVTDGRAQMEDWTDDFSAAHIRASWLNAIDDPVVGADLVRDYVTARTNHPVHLTPAGGYNMLHLYPELALNLIKEALSW